jgi:NitT/TauT family transport system substrate-binding protein
MSIRPMTKPRRWRRPAFVAAALMLAAACVGLATCGCNPSQPNKPGEPIKLKVGYIGLTCEAPIFAAQEKGFFKEEGLDVELVPLGWDTLQVSLSTGKVDANHTLLMYLLQGVEKDLDVKITGGVHMGCLRIQAGANTDIKTVDDLKGKTIGVPAPPGSPPHMFAQRVLAAHHLDPSQKSKDVTWKAIAGPALGAALKSGEIQAVADSEPLGSRFIGDGLVKAEAVADQMKDDPYRTEYCCVSVVSGKLARENPTAAAKVTRALLKAAKWVGDNPKEASALSVDETKHYVPSSPNIAEINTQALLKLNYTPGVSKCRKSLDDAAEDMKRAGLLHAETDPKELAQKAWQDLDGVTDDWVNGLKVEKAAAARPALMNPVEFAALFAGQPSCCGHCCCIGE